MELRKAISTSWVAIIAAASVSAFAGDEGAVVKAVSGTVFIEQSDGYSSAKPRMFLHNRDSVITGERGSTVIAFDNGCGMNIPGNKRVAVSEAAMCCIAGELDQPIAFLRNVQGSVFIDQQRFAKSARSGMGLSAGMGVRTGPGASAVVEYGGGCNVFLEEQSQLTVEFAEQCCLGLAVVDTVRPTMRASIALVNSVVPARGRNGVNLNSEAQQLPAEELEEDPDLIAGGAPPSEPAAVVPDGSGYQGLAALAGGLLIGALLDGNSDGGGGSTGTIIEGEDPAPQEPTPEEPADPEPPVVVDDDPQTPEQPPEVADPTPPEPVEDDEVEEVPEPVAEAPVEETPPVTEPRPPLPIPVGLSDC